AKLKAPEYMVGMKTKCPRCQSTVLVANSELLNESENTTNRVPDAPTVGLAGSETTRGHKHYGLLIGYCVCSIVSALIASMATLWATGGFAKINTKTGSDVLIVDEQEKMKIDSKLKDGQVNVLLPIPKFTEKQKGAIGDAIKGLGESKLR